jgi:hypothetical protein
MGVHDALPSVWIPLLILVVLVYIPYGDRRWYLHCITGSVHP